MLILAIAHYDVIPDFIAFLNYFWPSHHVTALLATPHTQ